MVTAAITGAGSPSLRWANPRISAQQNTITATASTSNSTMKFSPEGNSSDSRPEKYTTKLHPMAKAAATTTSTSSDCARSASNFPLRTMHANATSGNANRKPWATASESELTQRNRKYTATATSRAGSR